MIISCLLALAVTAPPDAQADFTAANERALNGDLKQAIALYESLVQRGVRNADVLYNLGNAYARQDRLIDAVVAYERALRLAPGDEDIVANLKAVRAKLAPSTTNGAIATPEAPLNAADALSPWLAPSSRPWAALLLILGHALVWGGWWYRERRLALVTAGGLLSLFGAGLLIAHVIVANDQVAIVTQPTPLREGPRAQFRETGKAAPGTRVRIIDDNGPWREVQRDDGTTGWLRDKDLSLL